MRKLSHYAFDTEHRVGRHKARLFASLLGMGLQNTEELQRLLLEAVQTNDAILGTVEQHGQRYQVDFELYWRGRHAFIRSAWIVRPTEEFPWLVSCYPLQERNK